MDGTQLSQSWFYVMSVGLGVLSLITGAVTTAMRILWSRCVALEAKHEECLSLRLVDVQKIAALEGKVSVLERHEADALSASSAVTAATVAATAATAAAALVAKAPHPSRRTDNVEVSGDK